MTESKTDEKFGTEYIPRVSLDDTAKTFEEQLQADGFKLADFKKSKFFTSGEFAKLGEQEERMAKELGFKASVVAEEDVQAASAEGDIEGDASEDVKDPHKRGKRKKRAKGKPEESGEAGAPSLEAATGVEAHLEAKSTKTEDPEDNAEADPSDPKKKKKGQKGDAEDVHAADDDLNAADEYDAVLEQQKKEKDEADKLAKQAQSSVAPTVMNLIINCPAAVKLNVVDWCGAKRVLGNDVHDLRPYFVVDAQKTRHRHFNTFMSIFIKAVRNTAPVPTKSVNQAGGLGLAGEEMTTEIVDPDADNFNLLSSGSAMSAPSLRNAYGVLSGVEINAVRGANLLRIDEDYSNLPNYSTDITNQAAVLSGDMYRTASHVIMSEERITRQNAGKHQYRKRVGSPTKYLQFYGKNAILQRIKGTPTALFTQDEVVMYENELHSFDIHQDMSFCIIRGFGNPANAIQNFSLDILLARDSELGAELREKSMAASREIIVAFPATVEEPKKSGRDTKINPDMVTAQAMLTSQDAARWATTCCQYYAGGAYMEMSMDVPIDQYMKHLAPFCAAANLVMIHFPSLDVPTQVLNINAVARPFCGELTDELRQYLLGPVNVPVIFANAAMANIAAYGAPGPMVLLAPALQRNVLQQFYNWVRSCIFPVYDTAMGPGADGRWWTYRQDRRPRERNGTLPNPGTALLTTYGRCKYQKGLPVGGNYYDRDMRAFTPCPNAMYMSDMALFGSDMMMRDNERNRTALRPYMSLWTTFMRLIVTALTADERRALVLFQNFGDDLVQQKGSGIIRMGLAVRNAANHDDTLQAGPGYSGVVRTNLDPAGSRQNYGTIAVEFTGALSFLKYGTDLLNFEEVNEFHAMRELSEDPVVASRSAVERKNRQMSIYIANEVMSLCTDPAIIPELVDVRLTAALAPGANNEYFLDNYTDEVEELIKKLSQVFYPSGSSVEAFALRWYHDREVNRQAGSPFIPLYFDYAPFQVGGKSRLTITGFSNANGQNISGCGGVAPNDGLGFVMPNGNIGNPQIPHLLSSFHAPIYEDQGAVAAADGVLGKRPLAVMNVAATVGLLPQIARSHVRLDAAGVKSWAGLTFGKFFRYVLVSKHALLPCDSYGKRFFRVPAMKTVLVRGPVGNRTAQEWRQDQARAVNACLPDALTNAPAPGDVLSAVAPVVFPLSKTDFQRMKNRGHPAFFDPQTFARFFTNDRIEGDYTFEDIKKFMEGGIDMRRVPTEAAYVAAGLSAQLAGALASYPNIAGVLSDIHYLANTQINLTNQGGAGLGEVSMRTFNGAIGHRSIYGSGLFIYAVREAFGTAPGAFYNGQVADLLPNGQQRAATVIPNGEDADQLLRGAVNYYAQHPGLIQTIMNAVLSVAAFEEHPFVMFKAPVEQEYKQIDDDTSMEVITPPSVSVEFKKYFSARGNLAAMQPIDAPVAPLDAIKTSMSAKVVVPFTTTLRQHVVDARAYAVAMNPDVNENGEYINPYHPTRHDDCIIGIIGTYEAAYDPAMVTDVARESIPTAETAVRKGDTFLRWPAKIPMANARRATNLFPRAPAIAANPMRRFYTIADGENGGPLINMTAHPVIVPKKLTILPFEFESPRVISTRPI
uniref:Uncharacterized protein n=1 Tax=viral metagenome TaxID=1070528 RepID=A0A2V0RAU2_9ZZZZ